MNAATDQGVITDAKKRQSAGVLKNRQMGYWDSDDVPKDTDTLCPLRITPQDGMGAMGAMGAAASVAGESSTATWSVVWTDRLTVCGGYRAKGYKVEPVPVPVRSGEFFAWVACEMMLTDPALAKDFVARTGPGTGLSLCQTSALPNIIQ